MRQIILKGKNIKLARFCANDSDILFKWHNDFNLTVPLGDYAEVYHQPNSKQEAVELSQNENSFAIVNNNDELLGICKLINVDNATKMGSVQIYIGDMQNRNKGYGSEALKLLLKYAFESVRLNNIELGVYEYNSSAIKCYEGCGFVEFGRRRKCKIICRKRYDIIWMQILLEDYKKRQAGVNNGLH
ncbi:MAG: family N-acetyltransferase [Clostridia bacterium]|nr:family N-acetyltransferase [Clostridia bacterium]